MAIGLPDSIKNTQVDAATMSALPIINIRDIDLKESISADPSPSGDITVTDCLVLQRVTPIDSANIYHTTVSAFAAAISAGQSVVGNYLPLSGGELTGSLTGTKFFASVGSESFPSYSFVSDEDSGF
jgi:hypothetical protein